MNVIAIYSSAPQSGKSTVANYLCETYGFERRPFAAILKQMLRPLYTALGYSEYDIEGFETVNKQTVIQPIGKTPRFLMQKLGTEWGRNMVSETVWLDAWRLSAEKCQAPIVVDDMRFHNELELIRSIGGSTLKLTSDFSRPVSGHASEGALDACKFDFIIGNVKGNIPQLQRDVDRMLFMHNTREAARV